MKAIRVSIILFVADLTPPISSVAQTTWYMGNKSIQLEANNAAEFIDHVQ